MLACAPDLECAEHQPQRRMRETILPDAPSFSRIDQHHTLGSQRRTVSEYLIEIRRLGIFRQTLPFGIDHQHSPALAIDRKIGANRQVGLIGDGFIDRMRRLHGDRMIPALAKRPDDTACDVPLKDAFEIEQKTRRRYVPG